MVVASLMQSPWWLTAGWLMVHFLWIGCVVGLVAAAGRWLLSSRPEQRYAFAVACFAVLSCVPGLIIVCLHPEVPNESSSSIAHGHMDVPMAPADAEPLRSPVSAPEVAEATEHPMVTLDAVVRCLPWLWMIGTPLIFFLVALGLIGSERLRRQSERLDQRDLANRCRRLSESLGIHCHVALGVCARLTAPILVGILKPVILLPPAALSGWSAEQLEMVLLHELAHVRRWDNLVNLGQRIVEALLFFHPVVWWLSAWIRLEREMCCDQIVVAHTGNPRAYAETLAAFAAPEPLLRTGSSAMAENRLVSRIRRILNLEDRSMKISTKLFGLTTVLLVTALLVVGLHAYGDNASPTVADEEEAVQDKKLAEPRTIADDGKKAEALAAGAKSSGNPDKSDESKNDAKKSLIHPATVEAYQQLEMYSRIAGSVKAITVDVGDRVKRGQPLIELDAPDVQLELKQKSALVQQAKAEINQAKSSVRAAQATFEATKALVVEAEAGIKGARANLEFRKKQFERLKKLLDTKAIAQETLDEAREKVDAAQAGQAASEAKWQVAQATVKESIAKVVRAEADVQVAEAHVAVAEAGLQRTQQALLDSAIVRAPFDGVVTRRFVDVGTFIQAAGQGNAKPLITVARTDLVRIVVNVPQAQIARIRPGTSATIRIDAYPGKEFESKVSRLSPAVDRQTGTLRASIDLPNSEARLLPGMSGEVTFKLRK